MVNKKGWFKVFEATTACLILLGVFLFLSSGNNYNQDNLDGIKSEIEKILSDIYLNETLRDQVLLSNQSYLEQVSQSKINNFYNFSISICDLEDQCPGIISSEDVFVGDRIISSTLLNYDPKQIKLIIWEK